jgi:aspartate carbamoyltransferase regulatory subunit
MKELSLHILDIAQNSVAAKADLITINIIENSINDKMTIEIVDNGKGIPKEMLKKVTDPFVTSRTNRKVGLGIALFKEAAEMCDGKFEIESAVNIGTKVKAEFRLSHIDRAPLGNMSETMVSLISANTTIDIVYNHRVNEKTFTFDTREIKQKIEGISIDNIDILIWIKEYIQQGIMEVSE